MRTWSAVASAFLGLAPLAPAQRFGFTHRMLPADTDTTRAVALGDVDADGDLDAFVGNNGQDRLYLNDGEGVFADVTASSLPALPDNTWAVALGDVDGDGDLDALVGNESSNLPAVQGRLHLNNGAGFFTDVTATNLPAVLDTTAAVALGDVDGDGDLDAFMGNPGPFPSGGQNRLYLNAGTGVFADVTATNLPALGDFTNAVAFGDLDGDGDLDAFLGNPFPNQDRLYLNGGTGVFSDVTATNLPAPLDSTTEVVLGDVDGDGDLDVFVGNSSQQDRLYLNGGTGAFTDVTATNLPVLIEGTWAAALGDLDGDGDLDAFVGNIGLFPSPNGGQNRLYLNGGTGVFADVTATSLPALGDYTRAVALGDLDGDGDLDALVGNTGPISVGGQNRLYLNAGTATFADVTATGLPATPSGGALEVALGDVDGDGDLDAFLAPARLYLNGGTGGFADASATNLPAQLASTTAVALGDLDGDGDLDAFLGTAPACGFASCSGGEDLLYLNGGAGVFADVTATNMPALLDSATAVALGDVDGDGDLDAYVGNGPICTFGACTDGQDRLLLNGGTGVFADVSATNLPPLLAANTRAVALGDVDGDGDLDVFVGNQGFDRLYRNGGTGVFTNVPASNVPALIDNTRAVALGDVDGDGDLDAYVGNYAPVPIPLAVSSRLLFNAGTGVFGDVTATNLPALIDPTTAVALGDTDGDGDLDAFVGNRGVPGGSPNRLYVNGGTGVFSDAASPDFPALPTKTQAAALGDMDGDGDLDAFVGTESQEHRSYTNLTRQLAWRAVTRAGKPLVLDLHGPANGFWLLAAAQATASIPLPPLGTLRLHPAALFVVGAGALDPGGRASLTILVPPVPALVGVSTFLQAAVGLPARLTNLEISTVTSL